MRLLTLLLFAAVACAQPPGGPGGGPGGGTGDGIWVRNAAFGELETFDLCNGHQPGSGQYHHHVDPICLRAQLDDNVVQVSTGRLGTAYAEKSSGWKHSPILGWAFDGYPVYGPYGYSDPKDAKSAVKRVQPSFQLRAITQRHTLPTWILPYLPNATETLAANQYGPDVNVVFPLGRYVDDYDYVPGSGDLDQYNGRFTVTPDYPNGTYAYFVTVSATDGAPIFPYIMNVQFYGAKNGGATQNVAADAVDYFSGGSLKQSASADPQLATWYTKGSLQDAQAITGFDPSGGPSTTWPRNPPAGVTVSGGNATPALADVQRVRFNAGTVYVNSNNLPSYVMGPWFEATMTGGVFMNWAAPQNQQVGVTRSPAAAATKAATGMGAVGIWVNGVAIFNVLDGATYSNAAAADQGGGGVSARATHLSAASAERGPIAAGSLVSAYAEFNAVLATSTQSAATADWPATLGGATVTVVDSAGAQTKALIGYASPSQVNYQMPPAAAPGLGRVIITAGGTSVAGTVNIAAAYPGIFKATADGLAAAQTLTINGSVQTFGSSVATDSGGQIVASPISLATGSVYLILYGTGIGSSTTTATIGGISTQVAYSGSQGTYPGLDQVNLLIPASLAGKGRVDVVITAGGKASNPVYVMIP